MKTISSNGIHWLDIEAPQDKDLEQLKILEHGYKIKVAIVKETELGVDTPEDITKVEKYLCLSNTYS